MTTERKQHGSNLDSVSHRPMYAFFKDNEIVRVWVANDDDSTYLNIKKGSKNTNEKSWRLELINKRKRAKNEERKKEKTYKRVQEKRKRR